MENEKYNQIIDEAYRHYFMSCIKETKEEEKRMKEKGGWVTLCLTPYFESKDKFIDLIKTNPEFSEKWGLKIMERLLSRDERIDLYCSEYASGMINKYEPPFDDFTDDKLKNGNIPTKLTTIVYNNEKTEFYENNN
jgi:hypothetical protein